ncbi:uncharacterized protein TM35_000411860, partial [Trypanosoma theileri]
MERQRQLTGREYVNNSMSPTENVCRLTREAVAQYQSSLSSLSTIATTTTIRTEEITEERIKEREGEMDECEKSSIVESEEEASFFESDDAIDLNDLNRLYEYYKRRENVRGKGISTTTT